MGFSALEVLIIDNSFPFFASQVQPDPKFPKADAENYLRKFSTLPHFSDMAFNRFPYGSDLKGVMHCQKNE